MMATCRVCTAPIRWATDPDGRMIPLDEHEQLDYDPPQPAVMASAALGMGPRYRIVSDGIRPMVEAVPSDSTARTFVDHRYLCQQPRAI
jgi:hypothetical protein